MKRLFVIFSIGLFTVSILLYFLLKNNTDTELYKFGFDLAKLTAQMILIAFFGGILLQEYNRKRERKEARNEFRKSILKELHRAYTDTKKSRRILRAKCFIKDSKKTLPLADYFEEMKNINDVQLRLEVLLIEIDIYREAFSETETVTDKNGNTIEKLKLWVRLKEMEEYLDSLIKEYESVLSKHSNDNLVTIEKATALDGFMIKREETAPNKTPFQEGYSSKFKQFLETIKSENLKI